jgi:hypothetical protein
MNPHLNRRETKALAEWAFLKFCVASCQDNEIWCVPALERKNFMETLQIPKQFSVWMFRHNTKDWYDRYLWFSTRIYDLDANFRPAKDGPHNANTFALGFGRILFLCFFQWGIRIDTGFSRKHAAKLWPMRASGGFDLPEIEVDEHEVNRLAHLLPLFADDEPDFRF